MREADPSRPVDLDQVAARLLDVFADGRRARPDERPPTAEELEMKDLQEWRRLETEKYTWLVEEGGRPLYHISLLDKVSKPSTSHPSRGYVECVS